MPPLVDYSSSSSEGSTPPVAGNKRKRSHASLLKSKEAALPPPLPAAFHDLYAASSRVSVSDDPALHGGRKRTVAHQAGNWPSHVYLEWFPSPQEQDVLQQLVDSVPRKALHDPASLQQLKIESALRDETGVPRPLHISLSCPLILRTEAKDSFLQGIVSALGDRSRSPGFPGALKPFSLCFKDLIWVANAERTRWFLALRIARPEGDQLNKLLTLCNSVAASQGLPELYTDTQGRREERKGLAASTDELNVTMPREEGHADLDRSDCFHFSLAWSLQAPIPDNQRLARLNLSDKTLDQTLKLHPTFDALKVKIGNVVAALPF